MSDNKVNQSGNDLLIMINIVPVSEIFLQNCVSNNLLNMIYSQNVYV